MNPFSMHLSTVEDNEVFQDFADALHESIPEIERTLASLRKTPGNRALTDSLFRAIHNIKGDAGMCNFRLGVTVAHFLETLLGRFRNGEIVFSDPMAASIVLAIKRLELATQTLLARKNLDALRLPTLLVKLEKLAFANPDKLESECSQFIDAVNGATLDRFNSGRAPAPQTPESPSTPVVETKVAEAKVAEAKVAEIKVAEIKVAEIKVAEIKVAPAAVPTLRIPETRSSVSEDLLFFRSLALQFENRLASFRGRTQRILHLALETNKEAGAPVDPLQLEAAVYMQDIGMMFLPESMWLQGEARTEKDKLALRNHPGYSAELLQRMPGWEPAAEIVAQHHEMPNGGGYPKGLVEEGICAGAKILAIVEAFEAIMQKHVDKGKSLSVLRAISEINANSKQFSSKWVVPFNAVIRRTVEV